MPRDIESVLAAVREAAAGPIGGDAARVDRERAFPEASLQALAEAGGFGLVVPEAAGGSGGALTALAEACEVVGSACASSGMVYLMHSVTAATLGAGGADDGLLAFLRETRILGRMSLCRVAYFDGTGRRITLSSDERDRMMLADRDLRREVLRASRMYGLQGCLILLREPSTGLEDLGQPCPEPCP